MVARARRSMSWPNIGIGVQMPRLGVSTDDPRNAGIIEYFRPKRVTRESVLRILIDASPGKPTSELMTRVESVLEAIARHPVAADPPLSQSLDEVDDPWFGLDTHPDIIEAMWKLDESLPQRCRWVLWGRPALVHAESGVVFGVGFGTIGFVLRLSPELLKAEPTAGSIFKRGNLGQTPHDIGLAGPEWRFVEPGLSAIKQCGDAHDFAGIRRDPDPAR
jgi:hypothetical protein